MSHFLLGEIEHQALRSQKQLHEVNQYGLRAQNIIRISADGVVNPNDSQLTFTCDSSRLSGNIPLNKVQMQIEYEVVATGPMNPVITANNNGFNNANWAQGYLTSVSNGGLDALVGNKSFSSVEISNKTVQLVQDSRTPEKIDILSRLLSAENLRESGIYLDNVYGSMDQKAGGKYELTTMTMPDVGWDTYLQGCNATDILERNTFWKRNTNQKYITKKPSVFKNAAGAVIPSVPFPAVPSNASPYPYALTQFVDGKDNQTNTVPVPWYDFISVAAPATSTQTTRFTVKEDLLHDIFVSDYQSNPVYQGLPTSDLVFKFTKSNVLNSLYKTSNKDITNISVKIVGMQLNIFTFNYGILDIPIKDYHIPFFSETVHQENIQLSINDKEANRNKVLQTRQYNSVPQYLIIYNLEPTPSNGILPNLENALKPTRIEELRLQIDNETDGPLYNMNMDEIRRKTAKNLDDDEETIKAIFRHEIQNNANTKLLADRFYTELQTGIPNAWKAVNLAATPSGTSANRSFLDGVIVLKCGEDIRLPSDVCVGQDRKISFTFTISFAPVSNKNASYDAGTGLATTQFYQHAFFPSMYKFSPEKGLLTAERFLLRDDEFKNLVQNTNSMIRGSNYKHNVIFQSQRPLMVGSSFGNLLKEARSKMPMLKHIADAVSSGADMLGNFTGNDRIKTVGNVAKTVSDALATLGGKKVKKTVGRPRRNYA